MFRFNRVIIMNCRKLENNGSRCGEDKHICNTCRDKLMLKLAVYVNDAYLTVEEIEYIAGLISE